MTDTAIDPELKAIATELADLARPISHKYFRAPAGLEFKSDATPVTLADREIETAMRQLINDRRPNDGILGEEFGNERLDAEYVWVIDPIDGTKSFITGKPSFGTLIGLTRGGAPALGVIDQPITEERWFGVVGEGSWFNGEPIRTRPCDGLAKAIMHSTSPDMFAHATAAMDGFTRLRGQTRYSLFGADCYAYGLLACGWVDLVCEASMKPFDMVAPAAVVAGAGGVMTDWSGNPLTLASGDQVVASGDAALHGMALEYLSP